ncbi:unnamed protein product [Durusdinium trenchii]|uniref:Uncharacterized protein n=1 Tax=Durusdinium trenchii TaxID=1381693 RepID=A0ABP0N298_9DINO
MDPWLDVLQMADKMLTQHRLAALREFLHAHRSRCPGPVIEGAVCMVGYIVSMCSDTIQLQRKPFVPWEGFVTSVDSVDKVKVTIAKLGRRPIKLRVGSEIIILGKVVDHGDQLSFDEEAILLHRPCFDRELPFNALHLFAGAFCGWARALGWLHDHVDGVTCGSQVSVDADAMVLETWSKQHGYEHYVGTTSPFSGWDPTEHIGICTQVSDKTLLRRCLWPSNAISTVSPPCVSWSRGGKREGLNCTSGFAAFDAVQTLEAQQPLLIFFECADEVDEREITFASTAGDIPGHGMISQVLRQHSTIVCKWRDRIYAELSIGGRLFPEVIPPGDDVVSATIPFTACEEEPPADIVCGSMTFEQATSRHRVWIYDL